MRKVVGSAETSSLPFTLLIPDRQYNPAGNKQSVQCKADSKNRSYSPRPLRRRTSVHRPYLIGKRPDSHCEKQRLETFEPKQATRAQQRNYSKSCQDLRQHSSARRQQGRNNRKQACPLGVHSHKNCSRRALYEPESQSVNILSDSRIRQQIVCGTFNSCVCRVCVVSDSGCRQDPPRRLRLSGFAQPSNAE